MPNKNDAMISLLKPTCSFGRRALLLVCLSLLCSLEARSQHVALKTNLLYGAYTFTPNLSLEVSLGGRSTLEIGGGFNPWNAQGSVENNKKLAHLLGQIEYRYWFCDRFDGHFLGLHALGAQYNISSHELPMLFGKGSAAYRHEGWGVGAGVSYGYSFYLGKRWSLEATVGVGYAQLHYDRYDCIKCGNKIDSQVRHYFGPTKAGLSLIFLIK